jgi:hypothetical protein
MDDEEARGERDHFDNDRDTSLAGSNGCRIVVRKQA